MHAGCVERRTPPAALEKMPKLKRGVAVLALLAAAGCRSEATPPEGAAPRMLWSQRDAAGADARPWADAELAVFTTMFDRRVVALDAATGARRWSRALPTLVQGQYLPGGNVLAHGALLLVPGWDLFALDRATGEVRWRYSPQEEFPAADAIAVESGRVFSPGARRLHAVDAGTGTRLWAAELGERPFAPVAADGVVYFGTRAPVSGSPALGAGHAVALSAHDGRVLWRTAIPGHPQFPNEGGVNRPGALTPELFIVASRNGRVYGLDRASGQVRWEHVGAAAYESGVALLDGVAVVASLRGEVEGLDAATGRRLWIRSLGGSSVTTPIVAEDGCALVTLGAVICITADGRVAWERGGDAQEGPSFSTPVRAAAGRLFVGSTSGFHALRMER